MNEFTVTIPFAGHLVVTVMADDRKAAIARAMENARLSDVEDWETLETFTRGNVCCCPSPWEIVVENEDGEKVHED